MIRKSLIVVTLIAFFATLLPLLTLPSDQTLVLFWINRDIDYHWINRNQVSYEAPSFSISDYYAVRLDEGYLSLWVYRQRPPVSRGPITTYWGPARSTLPIQNLAIVFALFATYLIASPDLRRCWRRYKGRCIRCAYDLTGNVTGKCPECGEPIKTTAVKEPMQETMKKIDE